MHDEAWPEEQVVLICRVEGLLCSSLLLMEDKPSTDHQSLSQCPGPVPFLFLVSGVPRAAFLWQHALPCPSALSVSLPQSSAAFPYGMWRAFPVPCISTAVDILSCHIAAPQTQQAPLCSRAAPLTPAAPASSSCLCPISDNSRPWCSVPLLPTTPGWSCGGWSCCASPSHWHLAFP